MFCKTNWAYISIIGTTRSLLCPSFIIIKPLYNLRTLPWFLSPMLLEYGKLLRPIVSDIVTLILVILTMLGSKLLFPWYVRVWVSGLQYSRHLGICFGLCICDLPSGLPQYLRGQSTCLENRVSWVLVSPAAAYLSLKKGCLGCYCIVGVCCAVLPYDTCTCK